MEETNLINARPMNVATVGRPASHNRILYPVLIAKIPDHAM
jgi:hypothetical protein